MIKVLFAILLLFFSSESLSTTCFGEEQPSQLSKKYEKSVKFDFFEDNQEVDVRISAPNSIEGLDFTSATLVKGNPENLDFDFMFFPSAEHSGDQIIIYYMVKKNLLRENTLQLKYGPGCGKILQYSVST
ncbi:hypothetical protein [Microbulbifer elongatus]|uniref:hypothetical protein n=1 Tax=Microbulbifer elongatus TaxID=86173 RepID=UPI001CFEEAB3|nr:hypothetical protein [Microbulbifer elongatus]